MKLIAEAHTNKEIAEILHLSEKTVESHRGQRAAEARHADRVELVRYAIRQRAGRAVGPRPTGDRPPCPQYPLRREREEPVGAAGGGGARRSRAAVAATVAGRSGDDGPAAEVTDVGARDRAPPSRARSARRPLPATSRCTTRTATCHGCVGLRGKVVVLSPMYSTCEDTCPLAAQQIRGALDDLSDARAPPDQGAGAQRRPGQRQRGEREAVPRHTAGAAAISTTWSARRGAAAGLA